MYTIIINTLVYYSSMLAYTLWTNQGCIQKLWLVISWNITTIPIELRILFSVNIEEIIQNLTQVAPSDFKFYLKLCVCCDGLTIRQRVAPRSNII